MLHTHRTTPPPSRGLGPTRARIWLNVDLPQPTPDVVPLPPSPHPIPTPPTLPPEITEPTLPGQIQPVGDPVLLPPAPMSVGWH